MAVQASVNDSGADQQDLFAQLFRNWKKGCATNYEKSAGHFLDWAEALVRELSTQLMEQDLAYAKNGQELVEVGPYRLQQQIGAGGMGQVYLGVRRDATGHEAAIKILSIRGAQSHQLSKEARFLAGLKHPNIAHFLNSGVLQDGRPWLAMEYVPGVMLDQWIKQKQPNLEQRLALFIKVAEAVSHAHQNLLIHRDLKPANIIVEPNDNPKLLDFGIAAMISPDTLEQHTLTQLTGLAMTPEYASPEQVMGKRLTVATDIYSLGVILYEMLTGSRPYKISRKSNLELIQTVCEAPITQPSRMAMRPDATVAVPGRALRGDLDVILMKALERNPERRYPNAAALIEDLRNYCTGRPINARPASTWYQLRKFAMRNHWRLAFAGLLFLTLLGFFGAAKYQAMQLHEQAERIALERDRATQVTDFVIELFELNDPNQTNSKGLTAQQLMDLGRKKIAINLGQDPQTTARLLATMGQLYLALGDYETAESVLRDAIELDTLEDPFEVYYNLVKTLSASGQYQEALSYLDKPPLKDPEQPARQGRVLHLHGNILFELGHYLKVPEYFSRAENLLPASMEAERIELYRSQISLKSLQGNTENSVKDLEDLLIRQQRLYGRSHTVIAETLLALGNENMNALDFESAKSYFNKAHAMYSALLGEDHPVLIEGLLQYGRLQDYLGDKVSAQTYYNKALKLAERHLPEDHPDRLQLLTDLAEIDTFNGHFDKAEATLRAVINKAERQANRANPLIAEAREKLAYLYTSMGKYEISINLLQDALSTYQTLYGENNANATSVLGLLAHNYTLLGRFKDAKTYAQKTLDQYTLTFGEDHPFTGWAQTRLAATLIKLGEIDRAEQLLQKALAQAESLFAPGHSYIGIRRGELIKIYLIRNRVEAALELIRKQQAIYAESHADSSLEVQLTNYYLAMSHWGSGQPEEAIKVLADIIDTARSSTSRNYLSSYLAAYGQVLLSQKKFPQALPLLEEAYEIDTQELGDAHYYTGRSAYLLAHCLMAVDQPAKATVLIDAALDILPKNLPENHWHIAVAKHIKGAVRARNGNLEAGVTEMISAYKTLLAFFREENHPEILLAKARMEPYGINTAGLLDEIAQLQPQD